MFRKCTVLLAAALFLTGCEERTVQKHSELHVIAMAPNTAEILYALGLSNEVVGISRFCSYPPDVTNKPTVGGLYDPNWEMIVALQPDLVIGLKTQKEIAGQLKALGIEFLGVSHEHIGEILQSILTIGKACGAEAKAQQLFQLLENKVGQVSSLSAQAQPTNCRQAGSLSYIKPRVLVCVGHDETLSRMYVAAKGTFYDELINLAGGTNACGETTGRYPEISPEGLATMHPDVVIDILPAAGKTSPDAWTRLQEERPRSRGAVTEGSGKPYRAITITNDYASIPGPRFVLLLEDFTKAIHE